MRKNSNRKNPAIVTARTIEVLVDGSLGIVNMMCGHCGKMTSEELTLCYWDPKDCGTTWEEQEEAMWSRLSDSQTCKHCHVFNVFTDVEDYLRRKQEALAQLGELTRDLFNDQ